MMLFLITTCLTLLEAAHGAIYIPKQSSYLTPGVKDFGLPIPVKLVKVTNTVAVPVPYPVHVTRQVPFPVTVTKPFPYPVPHPVPVEITKPVILRQPVPISVPKPVAVPKPYILDGELSPPPFSSNPQQDYLSWTLYGASRPNFSQGLTNFNNNNAHLNNFNNANNHNAFGNPKFDYQLNQPQQIGIEQSAPGSDYDYTAPPDVSSQQEFEDGPSQDFVPPPEGQQSSEFAYNSGSTEFDSRDAEDSYNPHHSHETEDVHSSEQT